MSLFNFLKKPQDEPLDRQRKHVMQLPVFGLGGVKLGDDCDVLLGSTGDFGSESNPIPVNGPGGEVNYLNRLFLLNGERVLYHRTGTVESTLTEMPLDCFEIVATDASVWRQFHFSAYHPRRSKNVPLGFRLRPWHEMSAFEQASSYLPQWGVTSKVADFPHGLPAALSHEKRLAAISPHLGPKLADVIQRILNRDGQNWDRPVRENLSNLVLSYRKFTQQYKKWQRLAADPTERLVGFLTEGYAEACIVAGKNEPKEDEFNQFMQVFLAEQETTPTASIDRLLLRALVKCWSLPSLTTNEEEEVLRRARIDERQSFGVN